MGIREMLTMEASTADDVFISVLCSERYDLQIAAVAMPPEIVGEACFPASAVIPQLRAEDRDADGFVCASEVVPFAITKGGRRSGRIFLSFEARGVEDCCATRCLSGATRMGEDEAVRH